MIFQEALEQATQIPEYYKELLWHFYDGYQKAAKDPGACDPIFLTLLGLIKEQCAHPFVFPPYHQRIRAPFDYYRFGLDFTRPLLQKESSTILSPHNLQKIERQIEEGHNVVLFANHQTELDPQIIGCLLEEEHPKLAEEMIFVAGQKVITDLLAIPFSMGCNLLCIYSKRHIDHDENKIHKQQHNRRTMKLMSSLLEEGGKCIYVAPSGGRDRANSEGVVEVAPFDPDSIEMFRLMARAAKTPTHFYPLALSTFDVLPPPSTIERGIGEKRSTKKSAVHISFGDECDMNIDAREDKHLKRKLLADTIWRKVADDYKKMG